MTTNLIFEGTVMPDSTEARWNALRGVLITRDCLITFTKVNGEPRVMRCTLRADQLPPAKITEEVRARETNYAILNVWDLDAAGWRSFRVDNVTEIRNAAV